MGYKIKAEIFNMETSYYYQKMKAAGLTREEVDEGEADFLVKLNRNSEKGSFTEKTFKDFERIKTKINDSKIKGDNKYRLIHEERLFSSSQNQFRIYLEYSIKDSEEDIAFSEDTSF